MQTNSQRPRSCLNVLDGAFIALVAVPHQKTTDEYGRKTFEVFSLKPVALCMCTTLVAPPSGR